MSKTYTYIQPHPPSHVKLADNEEWENQCARCGSSMYWEQCTDPFCNHDDPSVSRGPCTMCDGRGGWWCCMSDAEWCKANPMDDRDAVRRDMPEWFVVKLYAEDSR